MTGPGSPRALRSPAAAPVLGRVDLASLLLEAWRSSERFVTALLLVSNVRNRFWRGGKALGSSRLLLLSGRERQRDNHPAESARRRRSGGTASRLSRDEHAGLS